ncbi:hypothetical protein PROFUN_02296 [Planoprotostelium fungivorum]|uniref:Uncharacterized protein n=1 Tax=Planoprotostelium fungivorum TaxID=1890364 RepID=A0A2P6NYM3_9EUKA|nr:hypothetical protein PROFUN_02296 [Planoprotostelium fungivorum]
MKPCCLFAIPLGKGKELIPGRYPVTTADSRDANTSGGAGRLDFITPLPPSYFLSAEHVKTVSWRLSPILLKNNKMRAALSLFVLYVALSQAAVYVTSITTIPTTGYFSPLYRADPPAAFQSNVHGLPDSASYTWLCDGQREGGSQACGTYQVVVATFANQSFVSSVPINITVTQIDIVQITLGRSYTSPNKTLYTFTSSVPYIYTLSAPALFSRPVLGFGGQQIVPANAALTASGSAYPLYATTFPQSYSVKLKAGDYFSSSFVYQNVTYATSPSICASQDAVVLVDLSTDTENSPFLLAQSCAYFFDSTPGLKNATVISAQTPATLSVSTTGQYNAACQTYGNSSDHYALVKLVNADVTSGGGFINGQVVIPQSGPFDTIYNCGSNTSIALSIQVNGPYQTVSINASLSSPEYNLPLGFYQINLAAGITIDAGSYFPLSKYTGQQGCSTAKTFNYFGYLSSYEFNREPPYFVLFNSSVSVCYTVTNEATFNALASATAFIIQPPAGYCLRSDGIPSNSSNSVYLYSNSSSSLFYEDNNTTLFTLTCSNDVLYVHLGSPSPVAVNFTLVAINTLGSYGQTYDVNGLSIIQYPPLTAAVGVLTVNLTGSVAALNDVIGLNGRKRTVDFTPLPSNSILTSSSGISQFLVAVRGRGQVSAELGTAIGVNVGYDTNYSLIPSTSSAPTVGDTTSGSGGGSTGTASSGGGAGTASSGGGAGTGTSGGQGTGTGTTPFTVPVTGTTPSGTTIVKPVSDASVIKAALFAIVIPLALF